MRLQRTKSRPERCEQYWTLKALFPMSALLLMFGASFTAFDGRRLLSVSMSDVEQISADIPSQTPSVGNVCPQALHLLNDDSSMLKSIHESLESFHHGGGNLKLLEEYLNSHMDKSIERFNMKYYPDGKSEPLEAEGVTKHIIETQKKLDTHKRGGYDQRKLPGHFKTVDGKVLQDFRVDSVEPFTAQRWHIGLGPIAEDACRSMDRIRSGKGRNYDDKFMCSYTDLNTKDKNKSAMQQQKPTSECNMISIGSNGQWGFEETVVANTNCITHTFDCTVQNPKKPNVDPINFYPYCVANENKEIEGRQFRTYKGLVEAAKLTGPPDLFKMDVEGYEFDVMTQMLEEAHKSGTMDLLPTQISVELHYATRMYDIPWKMRTVTAAEIALFMGMMYHRGGYVPVHYDEIGPGCYSCAELLFVRMFCDK
ncbi:unnamed protein product [Cylindrotheca closterium]|uniref:Methyltransferase domain-containing protein n=1 Tax=Cylindrotheca closterium TaxID=2856 RepID=A0AAD2GE62_9STRA|nr:unnamed protein product [Cylindrotheca closterium]